MKRLSTITLCILISCNIPIEPTTDAQTIPKLETQKEAVDIVAAISENLAALIIQHKKNCDPETTKHHSVELVKSITEIITLCIMKAKAKKTTKNILLYDQTTLDATIEEIANSIVFIVENEEGPA